MAILNKTPLCLAVVKEHIKNLEEKKTMEAYIKRFGNLTKDKAEKLKEELIALNNPKINAEYTVKIIDFLPKDAEDLNKIMVDANLSEEESKSILDVVKKY
jgi:DNA-directed RNA polymerase subunit F